MLRRRDFLTLLVPAICAGRLQAQLTGPGRGNDWEVRNPKDAEFQPMALEKLTAALKGGTFPNTHAVLIEHDGRLVYEQYFAETDERWGQPLGKRVFDSVPGDHSFIESEPGFRAIPIDEFSNRMIVGSL
jgi:hypothetical protein